MDFDVITSLAFKALIYEVSLSPKPGLVDAWDSGAHQDMDYFMFVDSCLILKENFIHYLEAGAQSGDSPQALLAAIRPIGMEIETKMFAVTGGVNTHKGANFSFGVLLAAVGKTESTHPERVIEYVLAMTQGLSAKELNQTQRYQTHGEKMFQKYGVRGIRGEVEEGFPTIMKHGLPYLKENQHLPLDIRLLGTLLAIMAHNMDSNILKRGGLEGLEFVKKRAADALCLPAGEFKETMRIMNQEFISKNLSPGGSADLLSLTIFLAMLDNLL